MQISRVRLTDTHSIARQRRELSVDSVRDSGGRSVADPHTDSHHHGRDAGGVGSDGARSARTALGRRSLGISFRARNTREVRPLCSTGITPLPRSNEPVRLPTETAPWLWIPTWRRGPALVSPGLPVPRPLLSTRALPNHPERVAGCPGSLLPRRWQASASSADWPPPLVSRGRIGFACARARVFAVKSVPALSPIRATGGPVRFARIVTSARRTATTC
jgi:hypothetical protein